MGREGIRVKDQVQLRLYNKEGQLIHTSQKKKKIPKFLKFLFKLLGDEG